MTSEANIDDYYAQVPPSPAGEGTETKTGGLKLKIKAKKVFETLSNQELTTASSQNPDTIEKKVSAFVPAITFEKAPSVAPSSVNTSSAKEVLAKKGRTPLAPEPAKESVSTTTNPSTLDSSAQKPAGFRFDTNRNFKVRKPQAPRISFAPAPKVASTPKSSDSQNLATTPSAPTSPNRLQAYAKTHQNAPKRWRNSVPNKKPGGTSSYEKPKKGFKISETPEDDGKFRRGKKIAQDRREKDLNLNQILTDRTGQEIAIPEMLSVKEFSEKIGVPLVKIIGELMKNGVMTNINTKIDFDTCFLIGETFQVKMIRETSTDALVTDIIEGNIGELLKNDDPEKLISRAPIISIMGHVDHGKTSILDYIRKTQVASGEAGGITQKIGAYQVEKNGKKITFLDTPGHEAFSIMRSRGAKLTDLAVIVIAADEGMKPQTIESINHAKAADIPMIIAANKMDKPGANLDLIRGQLAEQGLQPEDWGGDTVVVPVSAHTGLGIETLLDMILLLTDMMELRAHPTRTAVGTVIESHLDPKLGPLSTVLINSGLLKKGDYITCALASGRVRALKDYRGKNMDEAGPATPVQVSWLSQVVEGWDIL